MRHPYLLALTIFTLCALSSAAVAQGDQDRILWRFEMDTAISGWEVSVGPDGTIYTSDDTKLYAINPDGSVKWTTTTVRDNTPIDFLPDGTLITRFEHTIYALDPGGNTIWTFTSPGNTGWSEVVVGPTVGPDGNIYAVSGLHDAEGLGAFSLTPQGELRWNDGGSPPMAPLNGDSGGPVYFTQERLIFPFEITEGGRVYGYDFTGQQTLYVDFTCLGIPRTDPLNRLLLASGCGIEALEQDGNEIYWRVQFGAVNLPTASGADGTAYSSSWFGDVNAINVDGTIKWTSSTATDAMKMLVARQDVGRLVYSGGDYGRQDFVAGVNTDDGTRLWLVDMLQTDGHNEHIWTQRAPTSADGNVVYFTTNFSSNGAPGALYAVWITYNGTPAEIDAAPLAFNFEAMQGSQATGQLFIDNLADPVTGRALNWSVDDIDPLSGPNYALASSDDSGGPTFAWKDITATGTSVALADEGSVMVPLPFPFSYFGETKTSVLISANGYLTFGGEGARWWNFPIPNIDVPNDLIAAFWDDLSPPLGGTIHYEYDSALDAFIVQYTNILRYGGGLPNTFEILFHADGSILFQYNSMQGVLNQSTVGIENSDGTFGIEVVFDAPYLHDNLAVLFGLIQTPDWLSENPASGSLPAETGEVVDIVADATGLAPGTYLRNLVVSNNDPDESSVVIPVTLLVSGLVAGVGEQDPAPREFRLHGNHPNPFNPFTTIRYELQTPENVRLAIYDVGGRLVRVLVDNEPQGAGEFAVNWDGRDGTGRGVASGVYFYRIEAGAFRQAHPAVLLR